MRDKEAGRKDRIDFVCIVTPNASHYKIAKAFLNEGFNIVCEKPLCFTVEEGEELKSLAQAKGVAYMTGLHPRKVAAVLDRFNMELEMNANILVEFENGIHGIYSCSQICAGHPNGFVIRIFGSEGAVEWAQESPDQLIYSPKGKPVQILNRGAGYVTGRAAKVNHLPSGHPEGLTYAFANIYASFTGAVMKMKTNTVITEDDTDYPTIDDGIAGMRFIYAVVESGKKNAAWEPVTSGEIKRF